MSNARQHPRVEVSITGNLRSHIDSHYTNVMMGNLSLGGAFVKTPFPLDPGAKVALEFAVPNRPESLSLTGEVVWTRDDSELCGMGIRFVDIGTMTRDAIREYINGLIQEEAA